MSERSSAETFLRTLVEVENSAVTRRHQAPWPGAFDPSDGLFASVVTQLSIGSLNSQSADCAILLTSLYDCDRISGL